MDLISHLPHSYEHDAVFTIVGHISKYVTFVPCIISSTALNLAQLFYDKIICKLGILVKNVSNRDSHFLFNFWKSLMKLL